jgi:hypothetical protein
MTLPRKGRVSIPDGVMVRELDGESVILNLDSEAYFGLDDVGTRMWSALTESETIETAYETLLAEYDATPEQLQADLGEFVEQLAASGLIDVREG